MEIQKNGVAPLIAHPPVLAQPPAGHDHASAVAQMVEPLRPVIRGALEQVIAQELDGAMKTVLGQLDPHAAAASAFHATLASREEHKGSTLVEPVKGCTTAGCSKPARSKGLCAAHYQAARRAAVAKTKTASRQVKVKKAKAKASKK